MSANEDTAALLQQQDYYRARAAEYDQWWLRQGRYDHGAALNRQWFAEAAAVSAALSVFRPTGRVLELDCGTGIWTQQLLRFAPDLTAVDGSPEMLALNAGRLGAGRIRYVQADIFQWQPPDQYDTVFFSFWLSHVPPGRFEDFWKRVRSCLAPGGRVFFVDSRPEPTSTALDHRLPNAGATIQRRRLNDGREFQVYKVFYDPAGLRQHLGALGWDADIRQTEHYFLFGCGAPASGQIGPVAKAY